MTTLSPPPTAPPASDPYRDLVAATARLLRLGERADRAVLLARVLDGLADVVPSLRGETLRSAAQASTAYAALLQIVNSPAAAEEWRAHDPFAEARRRGVEAKRHILAVEGGALTVGQVAERLGITTAAVDKRRRQGKLLALDTVRGNLYPAWQFVGDDTLPGLPRVLTALDALPWTQASWFLSANGYLGDECPLAALRRGAIDAVTEAADAFGEQGGT